MWDSWILQPVISPVAAAIAIGIAILLLLVGPSFSRLARQRRMTLTLLRLGVIVMAALALLRPGCVKKIEKNQSAALLFLLDQSRSMELPHQEDDSSRWGALVEALNQNQGRIAKLREQKVDVRFFLFDNKVTPVEMVDDRPVLPEKPSGGETDIATTIYRKSQDLREQRLLGVIMASDGVQNATDPEVELTQATDLLEDMDVPLYAMAFGLPANTDQVADIAITNLPEQHRVLVKNRLNVKATLVARGFANQNVNVQLIIVNQDGTESVVDSQTVQPSKSYEEIQIRFNKYNPPETGEFQMKVRANPLPGEVALRNNELPSFLSVAEGGLRVLFLDGHLRFEQTYLIDALSTAAQGIEVDVRRIHPGTMKDWPIGGLAELFNDPTYDVFIIGDLHSMALFDPDTQTKNLQALADAVNNGKGLLLLGGQHSFGPGMYQKTPLADIMPIKMDLDEGQDPSPDALVRRDLHINRPVKLKPTKRHFITNLGGGDDALAVWKTLPALTSANRFSDVKENAEVLLESDDSARAPMLVAGFVGGRVLAFAGDTTWRWFTRLKQDEYNQFWRQVVFWLAFWDGKNDDMVWIRLPQRRYPPKSAVRFTTGARTLTGEEIEGASFTGSLIRPDGSRQALLISSSIDENWGILETDWTGDPGVYSLEVVAKKDGREIGQVRRDFVVFDRDKEKANPAADPEQMARLASQTEGAGGRRIMPDELGELLDALIENPQDLKIEIPTKWQLGETMGDASGFLMTFVLLLGIEWWLRKKWGLV